MSILTLSQKQDQIVSKVLTFLGCTLFLVACANFKFFLPSLTPVPISMLTFAILVLGTMLPFRMSLGCFMAYFIEGLAGSPVFGMPFLTIVMTFGYFVGMVVALYFLSQKNKKMPLLASLTLATAVIWAFGVFHLQFMFGWKMALIVGFVPFVVGDLLKVFIAYTLIQALLRRKRV